MNSLKNSQKDNLLSTFFLTWHVFDQISEFVFDNEQIRYLIFALSDDLLEFLNNPVEDGLF